MPWKFWGWNEKKPFLGDLSRNSMLDHLFVERDELIEQAYSQIRLSIDTGSNGIVLVSGKPGVGKSTLLEFLLKRKFPIHGKRISLISTTGNVLSSDTEIGTSQLLDLIVRIDEHLSWMLSGDSEGPSSIMKMHNTYSNARPTQCDFDIITELVTNVIIPKARAINSKKSVPRGVIAIDDVDYLSPDSQIKILSLLCMLNDATPNPLILYSSRPVAAKIARHSIATRLYHSTGEPINVEPLDISAVIHARMTDGGKSEYVNPFRNKDVERFISKISNGNLRTVMNLILQASIRGTDCISDDDRYFTRDCLLRILFGERVTNKDTLKKDKERLSEIPNIFGYQFGETCVPVLYVTLLTIDNMGKAEITDRFLSKFNEICNEINPRGTGNKKYDYSFVENCLWYLHKASCIARTGFDNIEDYITFRVTHERGRRHNLMHTVFELTDRGKEMLLLTKDSIYQEITGLNVYHRSVQEKIKDREFCFETRK